MLLKTPSIENKTLTHQYKTLDHQSTLIKGLDSSCQNPTPAVIHHSFDVELSYRLPDRDVDAGSETVTIHHSISPS